MSTNGYPDIPRCLRQLASVHPTPEAAQHAVHRVRQTLGADRLERASRKAILRKITIASGIAAALVVAAMMFVWAASEVRPREAWALEYSARALEDTRTIVITGTAGGRLPFKCWAKRYGESLDLRYESQEEVVVVKGADCTTYEPGASEAYHLKWASLWAAKYWNKAIELRLFLNASSLLQIKANADDWQQTAGKDEQTGRDSIFVTCSYKPLEASFWFQFDLETKLIMQAKFWRNLKREGPPDFYASSITYDADVADDAFETSLPEGVEVVEMAEAFEEQSAAMDKAWKLFENKEYAEALKAYQGILDQHPELRGQRRHDVQMMIGCCYLNMDQPDKAIQAFRREIDESSATSVELTATYFYLGCAYANNKQQAEAIEAFRKCLEVGRGDPNAFPIKDAREAIERMQPKD
jgi:tetratricopeptide (TPR) repeat protein